MDVCYFLGERLAFIEQFYFNSAASFIERKRKIDEEEYPFIPVYSEDVEPAFYPEWFEASESLQILGNTCISMVSASFHLYFKTLMKNLGRSINDLDKAMFRKYGWFNGYKAYFLREFNIVFENSSCNLSLLEELVLVRNRVQHPESIISQRLSYSNSDLKKVPRPFFMDNYESELLADMSEGELSLLVLPAIEVTQEKLKDAILEIIRFSDWMEQTDP